MCDGSLCEIEATVHLMVQMNERLGALDSRRESIGCVEYIMGELIITIVRCVNFIHFVLSRTLQPLPIGCTW